MRRRGFTLIELLVVIAIIATLASMLVPAVSNALNRSRTVYCLSQTRQLALGMIGYSLDHGDNFPTLFVAGETQWAGDIVPYLGDEWEDAFTAGTDIERRKIFFCPAALRDHKGRVDPIAHGSYGMNGQMGGLSATSVTFPGNRFLLSDGHWITRWWSAATFYFPSSTPDPVHGHKANFAFADGHSGTVDEADYLEKKSYWDLNQKL